MKLTTHHMLVPTKRLILALTITGLLSGTAMAEDEGLLESTGVLVSDQESEKRIGASVLANVTRLYIDGRFSVMEAGIGLGVSWKAKGETFPLEIGGYLAPQFGKLSENGDVEGSVSLIAHATFFSKFGIGVGLDSWSSNGGFAPDGVDFADRIFFTLGYGLTNETKKAQE
ncbi:MAG: hypothetical protein JKY56_12900 [Kofleriaceae bacterium]|nr:hypothetical protein [Kofleriaceae bacterium]